MKVCERDRESLRDRDEIGRVCLREERENASESQRDRARKSERERVRERE